MTSVSLPASLQTIGFSAFNDTLTDVYYAGTAAQWENVVIDDYGNEELRIANMHWSS